VSSNPVSFLYDPNGTWIGTNQSGSWGSSAVYLGSRPLAFDGGGPAQFLHVNALDSTTMETSYSGSVSSDVLFYPWGDMWENPVQRDYQFAGTIWMDGVSSTDFATYRLYRYDQGRWLSPDPLAGDVTNPQSLNRYAYVTNNPLALTDPLGLNNCNAWNVSYEGSGSPPWNNCPPAPGCDQYDTDPACDPGGGGLPPPTGGGGGGTPTPGLPTGNSGFPNGDVYGPIQPLSLGQLLFPWIQPGCEFGACGGPTVNSFVSDEVRVMGGQFWMIVDVALTLELSPGLQALLNAGRMSATVASPWAPVAWYGSSAAAAVSAPFAPSVVPAARAIYKWAWLNPIAWKCAASFAYNFFSPQSPFGLDTDEYPCGSAGQMGSAGVWSISHPNGQ
jgi:RHS repeat-associated protein